MALGIWLEKLKNRFWVIPAIIIALEILLLILSLQVPEIEPKGLFLKFIFYTYSVEGSRLILSSTATSLITVVGVLFSVTIVILQQVSSQYSPRAIENFIKSISSQLMLGLFSGTYLFCLLALRHVPTASENAAQEIPEATISSAIGLSILCIGFLIHYVNHIVHAIQSTTIIANLKADTIKYWKEYEKYLTSHIVSPSELANKDYAHSIQLKCPRSGYYQSLKPEHLEKCLQHHTWSGKILFRPGDYVDEGDPFFEIRSSQPISKKDLDAVLKAFLFGNERTHIQDPRFGLRQLSDIALRALSPGINDPATAIESIHAIGSILLWRYSKPEMTPQKIQISQHGILEMAPLALPEILENALSPIFVSAESHVEVLKKVSHHLKKCALLSANKEHGPVFLQFRSKISNQLNPKVEKYAPLFNQPER